MRWRRPCSLGSMQTYMSGNVLRLPRQSLLVISFGGHACCAHVMTKSNRTFAELGWKGKESKGKG
jgi:hypothetical protein